MNKDGNKNSNDSIKSKLVRLIVGGIVLGAAYYSYKECRKRRDSISSSKKTEDNECNKNCEDTGENNDSSKSKLDELIEKINNDPVFGIEDLIINNKGSDNEFDDNHLSYLLICYNDESDEELENISVILKMEDTLYSKNRLKEFYDRDSTLKMLRDHLFELKGSNKSLKYKVEPLSFYFDTVDGIHGENIEYKEMRELKSISGFRYICIKFFNLENEGLEYILQVLRSMHPNVCEEGFKFSFDTYVLDKTNGIKQLEDNNISTSYLRS